MTNSRLLRTFRFIAFLEGMSFLILLGFAMPLKYKYGDPTAVRIVGSVHGALFVAYSGLLAKLASDLHWSGKRVGTAFLAAILPFGTFVFDRTLAREVVK